MDRDIISRKLDSLARCVRRIETKRPPTLDELVSNIDLQDKSEKSSHSAPHFLSSLSARVSLGKKQISDYAQKALKDKIELALKGSS